MSLLHVRSSADSKDDCERPISTIVFIIAMDAEALPILKRFNLAEDSTFFPGLPWIRYHGFYKDLQLNVIWPGKDLVLGVNNIGTIPAALVTCASVQALKPDLIINAGTAGGYMGRDLYGVGRRQSFSTPVLSAKLQLKDGVLSTGDSFDICPPDDAFIAANNANLVDMEGAAVAYVAGLLNIPSIFLKVVSNAVDGGKPSVEEFHQNLAAATSTLDRTVAEVVDFISGKSLSELSVSETFSLGSTRSS
ncbi:5'-methylthioadenosine nucleosidase-like isoform X2 [Rhodamnia argentea]|uniref:5'-methylthioadenosine nucleosidase-like isoform X2 n=1 Tax=Rhodamnia argentea TaxID=178133 RepID=A0ABM3HEB5_9MYRT|nr:5'-methylthioadenosine nucleosidase-like isoform X2 [Rhodamnia argentea]